MHSTAGWSLPRWLQLLIIGFGNTINLCIAIAMIGAALMPYASGASAPAISVYLGHDPADVCEPRLVPLTGGVMSHHCDRSVRCIGDICIGSEHGAANYEALDEARVTHIISAIGTCAERSDKRRPCLNLELADTAAEYGIVAALRRVRLWRESQHVATCQGFRHDIGDVCAPAPPTRIFVHCAAGVSRSATLAVGLMLEDDAALTYDSALARLREARAVVRPNPLFELALRMVAELGTGLEAECAVMWAWQRDDARNEPCLCTPHPETCLVAHRVANKHKELRAAPQLGF